MLVSCLRNILTKSFDFFENRICCGSPNKGTGLSIILFHKVFNMSDQVFDALKRSTADGLLGNEIEPDLDLIEPRSIRGCIVNLITRMGSQPAFNLSMLMGRVVVH